MGKKENDVTDEELFAMHRAARTKKKRKYMIILVSVIVVVLLAVIVGVTVLRNKITAQVNSSGSSSVESAEVTTGSISTTVSGSGTLSDEDVETLEILSSVEIVDYYVEVGDDVEAGDLIASVTNASVLRAMSEKQSELDALDEELEEASSDTASTSVTTSVAGRVKKINVSSGKDVATVMYESGALVLLSLDGYMAVDIETNAAASGEIVTVTTGSGSSISGLVENTVGDTATILVTDNGTTYDDTVTVKDSDGNELGTGNLYIHSQMVITGYAGTVSSIYVSENETVSAGETLLTLTDTETSANYDALLKERAEIEEQLNDLIKIYKEGGICAGISGTVITLNATTSSDSANVNMEGQGTESTANYTTIGEISPNTTMTVTISVDETDILSLEEGQEATVSVDSLGEDTFTGSVTKISTSATSESGVTSYSATVTVEKAEGMLSGMSASVVVTIEGVENALLIPVDALHQTSSTAYVYTEYDESSGEFSGMKEVTIGLSNSTYVEITEGLSEGEMVYYTASEDNSGMGFGDMPGSGGDMDFGNMPGGGSEGGSMPGGSGSGDRSMPSGGNMPGN